MSGDPRDLSGPDSETPSEGSASGASYDRKTMPSATPEPGDAGVTEFTIDELAAKTRLPSRTIRFYQSKGVLAAPTVRGRVAFYSLAHVERLKLVGQLQDRGLRIDGIRDLVGRIDKGEVDIVEWLGLDTQLRAPWADDKPRTMTEREILSAASPEASGTRGREGLVAELVRAKAIQRSGDVFVVESPQTLRLLLKLEAAGVSIETATRASEILRKHLARASRDLVDEYLDHVKRGEEGAEETLDVARSVALEAVQLLFAREMERVVRELVESGKTVKLPAKKKRARANASARAGTTLISESDGDGERDSDRDDEPPTLQRPRPDHPGPDTAESPVIPAVKTAVRALEALEATLGRKLFKR